MAKPSKIWNLNQIPRRALKIGNVYTIYLINGYLPREGIMYSCPQIDEIIPELQLVEEERILQYTPISQSPTAALVQRFQYSYTFLATEATGGHWLEMFPKGLNYISQNYGKHWIARWSTCL